MSGRPRSQSDTPGASAGPSASHGDIAAAHPSNEWQDRVAALLDAAAEDLHLLSPSSSSSASVSPAPALGGAYREDDADARDSYRDDAYHHNNNDVGDGADGEMMDTSVGAGASSRSAVWRWRAAA